MDDVGHPEAVGRPKREPPVAADVVEAGGPQHPPPGAGARKPEDDGRLPVGVVAGQAEGDELGQPVVGVILLLAVLLNTYVRKLAMEKR